MAQTEQDLNKAAALFAQLMISGVNIAQALFTRRGGSHQPNSVLRMRAHGGSGGGKKPAGGGGSGTPPPGGGGGAPPGGDTPPPIPPKKGIPRRKRKNSIKTRPQRAKTNTGNMDTRRGGHSKGKHGTQVTPAQHEDRLRTGRDPSNGTIPVDKKGNPRRPPDKSSGFDSNEKHLEALGKADAKLNEGLANGTLKPDKTGTIEVPIDVKDAGTSYSLNPPRDYKNGKVITNKVHKAKAVYRLDPTTGKYKLVTLYPE